jgi:hypothetical protein
MTLASRFPAVNLTLARFAAALFVLFAIVHTPALTVVQVFLRVVVLAEERLPVMLRIVVAGELRNFCLSNPVILRQSNSRANSGSRFDMSIPISVFDLVCEQKKPRLASQRTSPPKIARSVSSQTPAIAFSEYPQQAT